MLVGLIYLPIHMHISLWVERAVRLVGVQVCRKKGGGGGGTAPYLYSEILMHMHEDSSCNLHLTLTGYSYMLACMYMYIYWPSVQFGIHPCTYSPNSVHTSNKL